MQYASMRATIDWEFAGFAAFAMISMMLYGRNDNYRYNLHERAALSLNCIAGVLTDPSDIALSQRNSSFSGDK